jgi:2-pyrone-4,6-dicarboxylate lactonase
MAEPLPTYMHSPSKPKLRLPSNACDAHVHVFGPQRTFPFAADRPFTPADAPKEALFALHAMLGIERCVIVQSSCHGFDNSAVADAITAKRGAYCGVALLPTTVDDAELRRLDARGFCGVRFNFMRHLGKAAPIEDVIALTSRLLTLGWHLQIHCESSLIEELAPWLKRSAVPVVIDHMGRVDAFLGLDQPAFKHLRNLMRDQKFWVKVSGVDRISRRPPPHEDAIPFARSLVAEFGDRTLWGTDWPHPNPASGIPDDGLLVDLLAEIAPTERERRALLVDNPQRLYGLPRQLAAQ